MISLIYINIFPKLYIITFIITYSPRKVTFTSYSHMAYFVQQPLFLMPTC